MRLLALSVTFAILAAAPHRLAAQQPSVDSVMLPVGSVVRVRAPVLGRAREVGTVRDWRADTLIFSPMTTLGRIPIAVSTMSSLERISSADRGRQLNVAVGVTLGGVLGGSMGTLVALGQRYPSRSDTPLRPLRAGPILIGAGVGALLGGFTASRIGPRRWTRVPLPPLPRAFAPRRGQSPRVSAG